MKSLLSLLIVTTALAETKIDTVMPNGKTCGQAYTLQGKGRIKVDCYQDSIICFSQENKKRKPHGESRCFSKKGKLYGYQIFKDGLANGVLIGWDSFGEEIYRGQELNGHRFGKYEEWYTKGNSKLLCTGGTFNVPGPCDEDGYMIFNEKLPEHRRPKAVFTYNEKGEREGKQQEWWPNGHLKAEYTLKNQEPIEQALFYVNGKPQLIVKKSEDSTGRRSPRDGVIYKKSFSPNGKVLSEVINGNGVSIYFNTTPDSGSNQYTVFKTIYKNGKAGESIVLDSIEVAQLMRMDSK